MIVTGKQATAAIKRIVRKTKWSMRNISRRTGVAVDSICKIASGDTDNPSQKTMDAIDELAEFVEKL